MMKLNECPICNNQCNTNPTPEDMRNLWIDCKKCGTFIMSNDIFLNGDNDDDYITSTDGVNLIKQQTISKRCSLVYEFLLNKPICLMQFGGNRTYRFFYYKDLVGQTLDNPWDINVAGLMKSYPKNIGEKLDRILLNISVKFPNVGHKIDFSLLPSPFMFCESNDTTAEIASLTAYLEELGYIKECSAVVYGTLIGDGHLLTAKAWERIGELTKKQREINQGFIAMRFPNDKDDEGIKQNLALIRESFEEAINACGYAPRIMLDIEHNNQIVPEIFFEIEQSKFVVVDVTHPNNGAYYEAGYAQALGKQVIICCRKDSKPHFDISQKSMVKWTDKADLVNRLIKRITATVGANK